MKICFVILLFCASLVSAFAQTPYTAGQAQAIAAVKTRAANDGYTNPELTGIATVKGNFPVGPITLTNKFELNDQNKGKANFWGYLVRSAAKPDSSRAYVVLQFPIVGYQVFDAPAGIDKENLPGNFAISLPMNSNGSPAWMDSDAMVDRLRTNSTYQQYRQQRPDSTPDYVALGMSKLPTPEFPAGSPLWSITFSGSNAAAFLSCSVHALDGRVECIQSPVSVEENSFKNDFAVVPNPARTSCAVSIPERLYSPAGVIEMYNGFGDKVFSYSMSNVGSGYNVFIPVENYSSGIYFVRYTTGVTTLTRTLVIE